MIGAQQNSRLAPDYRPYDEDFFDDMLLIFLGMGRGDAGKYMYDNSDGLESDNLWEQIVKSSNDYYVPEADSALLKVSRPELSQFIPEGIEYVDFGIGGHESFLRYVTPTMDLLRSRAYIGLDFDPKILGQVQRLATSAARPDIRTIQLDFFKPQHGSVSKHPSLGVMNGVTLGNMYGAVGDGQTDANLVMTLKNLSEMTNFGWLLVSIDTNQSESVLMKSYQTPLNSKLNIASLPRAAAQLPMDGFEPSLFRYEPRWIPDQQLVAHMATALEQQAFRLGEHKISLAKGHELHLFNSYKFREAFFEMCCGQANLDVLKSWKHASGVMLYLLQDKANASGRSKN